MTKNSSFLKRLGAGVAIVIVVGLSAAIAVPLLVDVDRYRPEIIAVANQHLRGKLALGKLKLSLWGQIRIEAAGLELKDAAGRRVVQVEDAHFHIPFWPILTGQPVVTLRLSQPEVTLIRTRQGVWNVLSLLPEDRTLDPAQAQAPASAPPKSSDSSGVALPAVLARTRLGIELLSAKLSIEDQSQDYRMNVRDLTLKIRDLSLTRASEIELTAQLDTTYAPRGATPLKLKGPARLEARAQPSWSGPRFERVEGSIRVDLTQLDVQQAGVISKDSSITAVAEGQFSVTPTQATVPSFRLRFHNLDLASSGKVEGVNTPTPTIQWTLKSGDVELKPWPQVLPSLVGLDLDGTASLSGSVQGPLSRLQYSLDLDARRVSVLTPALKVRPEFEFAAQIRPDRLESLRLAMKAPGNDWVLTGQLKSFDAPTGRFAFVSSGLDLDQLMKWESAPGVPPAPKTGSGVAKSGGAEPTAAPSASPPTESSADYDAMLEPLRKNAMLRRAKFDLAADVGFLQAMGVRFEKLRARATFSDLVGAISEASLQLYTGSITARGRVDLKPKLPTYVLDGKVAGVDLRQAVSSQMPLFKNTLLGKVSLSLTGGGSSFVPATAKANLKARGKFEARDATFATIDVARMAGDALSSAVAGVAKQASLLKGVDPAALSSRLTRVNKTSRYDWVRSDYTIEGGVFRAPNFKTQAVKNEGIDLEGNTELGLVDYALKAEWQVIDTYNLTRAREVSINAGGVDVPHALVEGDGPFRLPIRVGGTALAPTYSYSDVAGALGSVVAKNAARALQSKLKGEAKQQVQKAVGGELQKVLGSGSAPGGAPVKPADALKGLGKKLFGR